MFKRDRQTDRPSQGRTNTETDRDRDRRRQGETETRIDKDRDRHRLRQTDRKERTEGGESYKLRLSEIETRTER